MTKQDYAKLVMAGLTHGAHHHHAGEGKPGDQP
jgi:hypothetical protein